MNLPDITKAQTIAAVSWVATQAVSMGLASEESSKLIVSIGSTIVAAVWVIADAWIKHSRNKVRAAALSYGLPDPALKK